MRAVALALHLHRYAAILWCLPLLLVCAHPQLYPRVHRQFPARTVRVPALDDVPEGAITLGSTFSHTYNYSSFWSNPGVLAGESLPGQFSGNGKLPTLEFLNPAGLRITVNYEEQFKSETATTVKFYINLNKDFDDVKKGDWEGTLKRPGAAPWTYTFPEVRVRTQDTVYYRVDVEGLQGAVTWYWNYNGYSPVLDSDPHGSGSPLAPQPSSSLTFPGPSVPQAVGYRPLTSHTYPPRGSSTTPPTIRITPASISLNSGQKNSGNDLDIRTCYPSATTFNKGQKACAGGPLFFSNESPFKPQSTVAGPFEDEDSFTVYSQNNVLHEYTALDGFKPTLRNETNKDFRTDGALTLHDCTSSNQRYCHSETNPSARILPPVSCGRVSTEDTLTIRYCQLEVTAKMAAGDWIVSDIWLVPEGYSGDSGQKKIIMARVRGNRELRNRNTGQDMSSRIVEMGVDGVDGQMFRAESPTPWTDQPHKYKLVWTPDALQFFVDNQKVGEVPGNLLGVHSNYGLEFYIVMGVHVGGDKDFQGVDKPWTEYHPKKRLSFWDARDQWYPTWTKQDSSMSLWGMSMTAVDE